MEPISAIILAPTRELAIQIKEHLVKISPKSIKIDSFIGGLSKEKQERVLNSPPHILIATPGRFHDLLKTCDFTKLQNLEYFIVDEADKMVEVGALKDLDKVLEILFNVKEDTIIGGNIPNAEEFVVNDTQFFIKGKKKKFLSQQFLENINFQDPYEIDGVKIIDPETMDFSKDSKTKGIKKEGEKEKDFVVNKFEGMDSSKVKFILVSATLVRIYRGQSDKDQSLQRLFKKFPSMENPKIIDLTDKSMVPENLKLFKIVCAEEMKFIYLYKLVQEQTSERFIIFLNSVNYAKKVCSVLQTLMFKVSLIHSGVKQNQRLKRLDKFKESKVKVLICTDVGARGLDIPSVETVIHFQIPRDLETFIHRSGRTARIGKEGQCILLVGPKDKSNYIFIVNSLPREPNDMGIDYTPEDR